MWIFLLWALLTFTTGLANLILRQQIIEEIERDLPNELKPSLKLWQPKRGSFRRELELHSRMYPNSGLRRLCSLAANLSGDLTVSGYLLLLVWSFK